LNSVILHIERERTALIEFIYASNSRRANLFHINNFFSHLLQSNHKNLIESYVSEFAANYFELIHSFEPFCIDPELTENLISQSQEILTYTDESTREKYIHSVKSLKNKLEKLNNYLSGKTENSTLCNFCFPLLENSQIVEEKVSSGVLESVSVQIRKSDIQNRFNIIPSERELENKIKNQIEISWGIAFNYVKTIIPKLHLYYDVVISFDNKWGIVQGNSLGTALTLTFIKELLKNYNAAVLFNAPPNNAYTGGFNTKGEIVPVSERIIKAKTTAVFFSHVTTFAVPSGDLRTALNTLLELNKRYPEKKLQIRGVEDFDDLISRRNLVDIRKINPLVRAGKFALKHSLSIILVLALAVIILISGLIDFDDNPKVIKYENQHLRVYNQNNKLIWTKKVGVLGDDFLDLNSIKRHFGIIRDVNGDGENEIILTNTILGPHPDNYDLSTITCYDKKQNQIWKFNFEYQISTKNINFPSAFRAFLFQIHKKNDTEILYIAMQNEYFPCAVFGIDILTGKRITDIFWHSGHLTDGVIFVDSLTKREKILLTGVSNGLESTVMIVLDLDSLFGQAIAPENYILKEIPLANIDKYILIPPTDYSTYSGSRYNAPVIGGLLYKKKENSFRVGISEETVQGVVGGQIYYYFNADLSINFIETGDNFQHDRDRLVKEGKLSQPLTYTPEYFEILKNNIKYWDGEKFVNYLDFFQEPN
jgi:hypothetical protein